MADPITLGLGALSVATAAGGAAMSAQGARTSADAQSKAYAYQAGIARQNQQIAKQNAEYALQTGEAQVVKQGLQAKAQGGQILAAQGASGINVASGSSAAVRDSQNLVSQMDIAATRQNASRTAYNYDVQATQYGEQASLYDAGSANAITAGNISADASILSGVSSVSSKWLQGTQTGLFPSYKQASGFISNLGN